TGWDGVGDEDDVAIRLELRSGVLSLSDLAYLIRAPPPRVPATCTVRTSLAAAAALLLAVCGAALCRTGHQSGDLPLKPQSDGGDDWLHLIIAASGKYLEIWNNHCSPLNVTNVTLLTLTYPFPCSPWNQINVTVVHPPITAQRSRTARKGAVKAGPCRSYRLKQPFPPTSDETRRSLTLVSIPVQRKAIKDEDRS
ncbi:hypothetical protein CCUS01_14262, partial [Colletotrichum cuscutae]